MSTLKQVEDAGWFLLLLDEPHPKPQDWAHYSVNIGEQNLNKKYTIRISVVPPEEPPECDYYSRPKIYKQPECVVCTESVPKWYFYPCGHLVLCDICKKSKRRWTKCPMCNERPINVCYDGVYSAQLNIEDEESLEEPIVPYSPPKLVAPVVEAEGKPKKSKTKKGKGKNKIND